MGKLLQMKAKLSDAFFGQPVAQSEGINSVLESQRTAAPKRGTVDFLRAYSESPWLRAVSNRVASGVSSVEWKLYRPVEESGDTKKFRSADFGARQQAKARLQSHELLQEVSDHPALDLLQNGNPRHVGKQLIKLTQIHYDLAGDSYWQLNDNNFGVPSEAWVLPPHWIEEQPSPNVPFYKVNYGGDDVDMIPAEKVIRFEDADPLNPYTRGTGIAKSLSDEIETDEYASKTVKNWFFNDARPPVIIQANDYTPENVRKLEQQWMARHRGMFRRMLPAFIRGQNLKIQEVAHTFEDMQLVRLRQFERDMVMQVFGVSPEIFGVLESSNRATIEAADYLFSRWVLIPRLDYMRDVLQFRLMTKYTDNLIIDFESPVKEDRDREIKLMGIAAWTMTMNEWRDMLGLDPVDDGDVRLIPLNMQLRHNLSEMNVDELLGEV
jgi:HK97 family phage portal protein